MKLFNLFKKETSPKSSVIEKMDANQLGKVVGGGDGTSTSTGTTGVAGGPLKGIDVKLGR